MGIYSAKASQEELLSLISRWAKNNHLILFPTIKANSNESCVLLQAYGRSGILPFFWQWNISHARNIIFELTIKPQRLISYSIILFSYLINIFILYFVSTFMNESIRSFHSSAFLHFFLPMILLTIAYILVLETIQWLKKHIIYLENYFLSCMKDEYQLSTILGNDLNPPIISNFSDLLYEICLGLMGVYISIFLGELFIILNTLFITITILPKVVIFFLKKNINALWKLKFVKMVSKWSTICFLFLSPFFLIIFLNSSFHSATFLLNSDRSAVSCSRFFKNLSFNSLSKESYFRSTNLFEQENLELLQKDLLEIQDHIIIKDSLAVKFYNIRNKFDYISLFIYRIFCAILFGILIIVFFYLRVIKDMLKEAKDLIESISINENTILPQHIGYYAKSKIMKTFTNIFIFVHYLIACIINIFSIYFSLEIFCYVFLGKTILLQELAVIFGWVGTIFITLTASNNGVLVGKVFLLLLAFPFYYILYLNIIRMSKFISDFFYIRKIKEISNEKYFSLIESLKPFIDKLSTNIVSSPPQLIIIETKLPAIYIKTSIISKYAYICISERIAQQLLPIEIKAMIAHEIGHLNQGIRKLQWLRLFSALTLFSNYYLTLCLDYENEEYQADKFAVSVMGESKSVQGALIKSSIMAEDEENGYFSRLMIKFIPSRRYQKMKKYYTLIKRVKEFYFGDGNLGYFHPPIKLRIERMREAAKNY